MEFKKTYLDSLTHFTTHFSVTDGELLCTRFLDSKLYGLVLPLTDDETLRNFMVKVDRMVQIDNSMFATMAEISKRALSDSDEPAE